MPCEHFPHLIRENFAVVWFLQDRRSRVRLDNREMVVMGVAG